MILRIFFMRCFNKKHRHDIRRIFIEEFLYSSSSNFDELADAEISDFIRRNSIPLIVAHGGGTSAAQQRTERSTVSQDSPRRGGDYYDSGAATATIYRLENPTD